MSKWDEELSDTEQHSGFKQLPKRAMCAQKEYHSSALQNQADWKWCL